MSIKTIKSKIRGIDKTHKVTKAMEAVSAVKMRKSQARALSGRPYALAAVSILSRLSGSHEATRHALLERREVKRVAVVVVTSDRGLAGSLNSSVIRAVDSELRARGLSTPHVSMFCLGKKGAEHFFKRGFEVVYRADNVSDDVSHEELEVVSGKLADSYITGAIDVAIIAFTSFVSTFEQRPVIRTVLPFDVTELLSLVKDIIPARGKYADIAKLEPAPPTAYTIEPDAEAILNELFPFLLRISVYHTLLEAKASEHSARMVAMKNASDKARDLSKELNRKYNKARQSLITREVSEIVGGMEAMAS
jgi:F-type H+-transporting ATPase subunit gamma